MLKPDEPAGQPFHQQPGRTYLLVNARSRRGREDFKPALQELQRQGIKLVKAQLVANPAYLKPLVKDLVERGKVDNVVVGGGDGTVSLVAGCIADRPIKLGLIPMGTANDFARNLKMDDLDIPAAVAVIKNGYTRQVNLGLAGDRYFLNVASIGLGAKVADNIDNNLKKWLGPLAYVLAAARALGQFRPVKVGLTFYDRPTGASFEKKEFNAIQICIANGHYYGGGLVSAPEATIFKQTLEVTVIEQMSRLELLRLLPGLRDGTYIQHPGVHHYSTSDILIETRHRRQVNLDGEVCQHTPLRFQLAPSALMVLTPPLINFSG